MSLWPSSEPGYISDRCLMSRSRTDKGFSDISIWSFRFTICRLRCWVGNVGGGPLGSGKAF